LTASFIAHQLAHPFCHRKAELFGCLELGVVILFGRHHAAHQPAAAWSTLEHCTHGSGPGQTLHYHWMTVTVLMWHGHVQPDGHRQLAAVLAHEQPIMAICFGIDRLQARTWLPHEELDRS
jgi:hypothetical protein